MWTDLDPNWRRAFTLAWQSFCLGSIPVGSVIVDENDHLVAQGRNLLFDSQGNSPLAETGLAHAEMVALSQLKAEEHPLVKLYTLYTTLEPCPMCWGPWSWCILEISATRPGMGLPVLSGF